MVLLVDSAYAAIEEEPSSVAHRDTTPFGAV